MHKGFDGLSVLVEQHLGGQLLKGDVFLFVGRCRRRAKVSHWPARLRLTPPRFASMLGGLWTCRRVT
ncbi:IS66 family insertion sequence element accessory protein TnpB [Archangium lansingense]|uniref:IS66 family insertion sequence element accessory protein TnpB n=1 Tax=Archangium lansingense TaxID=2995310 RepID=UPI003B7E97D4